MKHFDRLDAMIHDALSSEAVPGELLNAKVKQQLKGEKYMSRKPRKRFSMSAAVAVVTVMVLSITAFATWKLLTADQAADALGYPALAEAFQSEDALTVGESQTTGGYKITLHGIVSGSGLERMSSSVERSRSYAVVSIEKEDGSAMPSTASEDFLPFYVSPYIRGQRPSQVNIHTLDGFATHQVIDGIMYWLIECNSIEMFADRGIYLGVNTGTFHDQAAFRYDESTGEITTSGAGVGALFTLPIDSSLGNHQKAEEYLNDLFPSDDNGQEQE